MHTPWGKSDYSKTYGEGVTFYGTPSHGGFRVLAAQQALMPEILRNDDGWYEEDCDWAKVAIAFPDLFTAEDAVNARETLRNWFPAIYEQHFGVTLKPGESYVRDKELFDKAHAADWVTIAAWGDWADGVPKGMVGVVATLGGSRRPEQITPHRYFVVPATEYDTRPRAGGFVIDLERHEETGAQFKATAA